MTPKLIQDLPHWNQAKEYLKSNGYTLFQFQFNHDQPEGFHAWFISNIGRDIEIVTNSDSVQREIVKYNAEVKE